MIAVAIFLPFAAIVHRAAASETGHLEVHFTRRNGPLSLTYGDWNCLQCARATHCHECVGRAPDGRALCRTCAT